MDLNLVTEKSFTSFSEKCSLFRDAGIEYLFTDNYESVRNLSPYEFISNHVIGKMNCFHSVCGYNFSFGSGASGSSDTMRNLMLASGRDSTVVPPLCCWWLCCKFYCYP